MLHRAHESGDSAHSGSPGEQGRPCSVTVRFRQCSGLYPHVLVQTTLTKHYVPLHIVDLILDYNDHFRIRVSELEVISELHKLEVGIITGCTISVTLFALAMNMIVKSAECRGAPEPIGESVWMPVYPQKAGKTFPVGTEEVQTSPRH